MLWICWKKEYIPTLNQGKGRLLRGRNFKSRDLVILQDKNVPRSHWPMGRVIKIYPGHDGVARIVKTTTPANEIVGPANRLFMNY